MGALPPGNPPAVLSPPLQHSTPSACFPHDLQHSATSSFVGGNEIRTLRGANSHFGTRMVPTTNLGNWCLSPCALLGVFTHANVCHTRRAPIVEAGHVIPADHRRRGNAYSTHSIPSRRPPICCEGMLVSLVDTKETCADVHTRYPLLQQDSVSQISKPPLIHLGCDTSCNR